MRSWSRSPLRRRQGVRLHMPVPSSRNRNWSPEKITTLHPLSMFGKRSSAFLVSFRSLPGREKSPPTPKRSRICPRQGRVVRIFDWTPTATPRLRHRHLQPASQPMPDGDFRLELEYCCHRGKSSFSKIFLVQFPTSRPRSRTWNPSTPTRWSSITPAEMGLSRANSPPTPGVGMGQ